MLFIRWLCLYYLRDVFANTFINICLLFSFWLRLQLTSVIRAAFLIIRCKRLKITLTSPFYFKLAVFTKHSATDFRVASVHWRMIDIWAVFWWDAHHAAFVASFIPLACLSAFWYFWFRIAISVLRLRLVLFNWVHGWFKFWTWLDVSMSIVIVYSVQCELAVVINIVPLLQYIVNLLLFLLMETAKVSHKFFIDLWFNIRLQMLVLISEG